MKAVILAGGTGSRLAEETDLLPKPMVQIGEHPILWHICKIYAEAGVEDFVVATGYKGEAIAEYFSKFRLRQSDAIFEFGGWFSRADASRRRAALACRCRRYGADHGHGRKAQKARRLAWR